MSPALITLSAWLAAGRALARDALADAACSLAARLYVWGYGLGHVPTAEPAPTRGAPVGAEPPDDGYVERATQGGWLHFTRTWQTTLCGALVGAEQGGTTSAAQRWAATPRAERCPDCDAELAAEQHGDADELERRGCARCEDDPEPCETCVTAADVADPRALAREVAEAARAAGYSATARYYESDPTFIYCYLPPCVAFPADLRARVDRYRAAVRAEEDSDEPTHVVVGGDP